MVCSHGRGRWPLVRAGLSSRRPVNLIVATTSAAGLEVYAQLDEREHPGKIAGHQMTDRDLRAGLVGEALQLGLPQACAVAV